MANVDRLGAKEKQARASLLRQHLDKIAARAVELIYSGDTPRSAAGVTQIDEPNKDGLKEVPLLGIQRFARVLLAPAVDGASENGLSQMHTLDPLHS